MSNRTIIIDQHNIDAFCSALAKRIPDNGVAVDLGLVAKDAGIKPRPLYHCPICEYTGHDTGWIFRDGVNNIIGLGCPNDCVYGDDSPAEGRPIYLLEYDYDDDSAQDASKSEYEPALAAFHKFLGEKP